MVRTDIKPGVTYILTSRSLSCNSKYYAKLVKHYKYFTLLELRAVEGYNSAGFWGKPRPFNYCIDSYDLNIDTKIQEK